MTKKAMLKRRARRRKTKPRVKAGPSRRMTTELVSNPWNNGFDKVSRVIDSLTAMWKRKQIDGRQHEAGLRYRWAYQTCGGSMRSSLDDSPRGASLSDSDSPVEVRAKAAQILDSANRLLGSTDGVVVEYVAGMGFSIEETAARLYGAAPDGRCRPDDMRMTGKRLRDALTLLSFKWFGPDKKAAHAPFLTAGAKPVAMTTAGELERGTVATAGYDKRGRFTVSEPDGKD